MSQSVRHQIKEKVKPDFPNSTLIALVGGALGIGLTILIYFGLQRIFQHLPISQVLEAMHGTSNTLCFAGITSAATILPLMLTIFSFARRSKVEFNEWFYKRIKNIALLCCISFIMGLFTLTILSAPIGDMSEVSSTWYRVIYYSVVGGIAGMVGTLIGILILLYYAILHIVNQLNPLAMRDDE